MRGLKISELEVGDIYHCMLSDREVLVEKISAEYNSASITYYHEGQYKGAFARDGQLITLEKAEEARCMMIEKRLNDLVLKNDTSTGDT